VNHDELVKGVQDGLTVRSVGADPIQHDV